MNAQQRDNSVTFEETGLLWLINPYQGSRPDISAIWSKQSDVLSRRVIDLPSVGTDSNASTVSQQAGMVSSTATSAVQEEGTAVSSPASAMARIRWHQLKRSKWNESGRQQRVATALEALNSATRDYGLAGKTIKWLAEDMDLEDL